MRVTEHIHAIRVEFTIPLGPDHRFKRFTWVYLICGRRLTLIDSGVVGSWAAIRAEVERIGRDPREIELCLLTHAHPDHIGGAQAIREATGCRIAAHAADRLWIEKIERQYADRPVPGFHELVAASLMLDETLADQQRIALADGQSIRVLHTPGHSPGHVAFLHEPDGVLFTGDGLPQPDFLPCYDDLPAIIGSVNRLRALPGVKTLLSSFDEAAFEGPDVAGRCDQALAWIRRVHEAVAASLAERPTADPQSRTADVVGRIGLPPFAVNAICTQSIMAHVKAINQGLRGL